jgi:hypothetical protein
MMKATIAVLLVSPGLAMAAPFDGTWVMDTSTVQWLEAKPESFLLDNGSFTCGRCTPPFTVAADGEAHKVMGHNNYDMAVVTITDTRTVTVSALQGTRQVWVSHFRVSSDGNRLMEEFVQHQDGRASRSTLKYTRTAGAPGAAHALSGSWLADPKSLVLTPEQATVTFHDTVSGLQMSNPLGESYDARFDGKPYPIKGDPTLTTVSVERLGPGKLRETDNSNGTVNDILTMEVLDDGQSMSVEVEHKPTGAAWKYIMRKTS